jgi:lysozyme
MSLYDDLVRDEGYKSRIYTDTEGKLTGGIGHNFSDRGLSPAAIKFIYDEDVAVADADLDKHVPWWRKMTAGRQDALRNMAFNLGWPDLSEFVLMLAALQAGDYQTAAAEALASEWATEVGDRAKRIAQVFLKG